MGHGVYGDCTWSSCILCLEDDDFGMVVFCSSSFNFGTPWFMLCDLSGCMPFKYEPGMYGVFSGRPLHDLVVDHVKRGGTVDGFLESGGFRRAAGICAPPNSPTQSTQVLKRSPPTLAMLWTPLAQLKKQQDATMRYCAQMKTRREASDEYVDKSESKRMRLE